MPQVVALGELLIDFVPERGGVPVGEVQAFRKAAGGAPANVAVGVARLGVSSAFVGKVGEDPFGRWLAGVLEAEGVDVSGLRFEPSARTALAFVSLTAEGERDFVFYRHPSADQLHRPEEVDVRQVAEAAILHHGSISLVQEPSRSATIRAIDAARGAGRTVSFDPNLRLPLWPDAAAARAGIMDVWDLAHVVKISDEELAFLTGSSELDAAASLLGPDMRLLAVTLGVGGVAWFTPRGRGIVPGFPVATIDTTGAGDAFVAALLAAWARRPDLDRDEAALTEALTRANAYAALTTTRPGAIPALPTATELQGYLKGTGSPRDADT